MPEDKEQLKGIAQDDKSAEAIDPKHMHWLQLTTAGFKNADQAEEPKHGSDGYAADKAGGAIVGQRGSKGAQHQGAVNNGLGVEPGNGEAQRNCLPKGGGIGC